MIKFRILYIVSAILLISTAVHSQSASFATYMNPVFPGDRPDPTLTKIGSNFYASGSSFSTTPIIYHSTDLVHWEAISQPVSAAWSIYGQGSTDGVWGGQLVYYANKYWHFFGHWGTMYFVTAISPAGPWTNPVAMTCPASVPGLGMDNSVFIDEDGSWYLLVKNGQENNWILQLGSNGQPAGKILDLRWINPAPSYPFSWAEGPVMWKYKGYYYYCFAINAAGGQKVFRSSELTGDQSAWQNLGDFFNESDPKKPQSLFQGPNHCSQVVMLDDSTSWVIYQSYLTTNGEWAGIGRQGLLSRVRYNVSGKPVADYPINEIRSAPALPSSGIPWLVPHSDFFESAKLSPEWSLLGYSPITPWSLTARPGWLRLSPKNQQNTLIKCDAEHNYNLITKLDFNPKATTDEAGLRIMTGLQSLFVKLFSTVNNLGNEVVKFSFSNTVYEAANDVGNVVWLKLSRENHLLTAYFGADGYNWKQIGSPIDVKSMDIQQANYNSWTGNRQGLYVKGSSADFDLYIYRDAYSPIMAECPANHNGTVRGPASTGITYLDQIHNGDWALYAGVEFREPDTSTLFPLTFEATASALNSSGVIEVWLDSINSTEKIGECPVSSTGSLSVYKTFRANMISASGLHDVYLRFKGDSGQKLFQLKSFRFISQVQLQTEVRKNHFQPQLLVYPNPAKNSFNISTGMLSLNSIQLFDCSGRLLLAKEYSGHGPGVYSVNENLPPGLYILKLYTNIFTYSRKLIIEN